MGSTSKEIDTPSEGGIFKAAPSNFSHFRFRIRNNFHVLSMSFTSSVYSYLIALIERPIVEFFSFPRFPMKVSFVWYVMSGFLVCMTSSTFLKLETKPIYFKAQEVLEPNAKKAKIQEDTEEGFFVFRNIGIPHALSLSCTCIFCSWCL